MSAMKAEQHTRVYRAMTDRLYLGIVTVSTLLISSMTFAAISADAVWLIWMAVILVALPCLAVFGTHLCPEYF